MRTKDNPTMVDAADAFPSLRETQELEIPRVHDTSVTRSVMRDGMIGGTIAAVGVAAAFLIVDVARGTPLATPALLGYGLGRALGVRIMTASTVGAVVGYTLAHVAAFIALATLIAAVVRRAQHDTSVLAAALLLVAVAEFAFSGFVTMLVATSDTAAATWPQLALGNVLGWLLLGAWIWRRHPELRAELADAVRGTGVPLAHP